MNARDPLHGDSDRRSSVRRDIMLNSTLRLLDGWPVSVVIECLSQCGFTFAGPVRVMPGDLVQIGLPGVGAFPARVVRQVDGNRWACEFVAELPPLAATEAFTNDPVVRLGSPSVFPTPAFPEPVVVKWSRPVRLALLVAAIGMPWLAVILFW